jgi:concentrative nucleoside transporter, CNT family
MTDQLLAILRGLLGLAIFVGIAFAFSGNRRRIPWKLVGAGMLLQIVFAICTLHIPLFRTCMDAVAGFFVKTLDFSGAGAELLFGGLFSDKAKFGFIFAFNILPTIVFFAALTSALYYLGILQKIVFVFAWVMSKTMRLSGAESLSAAGNVFVGQTEAPLLIRPFLEKMTRSEIHCVMVGGMSTIAGGVMAAYVGLLGGEDPAARQMFALHLLTASILSAPAAVVMAKMLMPETEEIDTRVHVPKERMGSNLLDALVVGTTDGLKLALNVGAMLIAFTAIVALVNYVFSSTLGAWSFGTGSNLNAWAGSVSDGRFAEFNLQFLLGLIFAPVAWVIGVPSGELLVAGQLLGEKLILNEFVAYNSLATLRNSGAIADPTSVIVLTYALCGFSNFVSIGIQIGGISALAPGQRENLAGLGWRALLGGTLACLLTACVALMVT